MGFRFLHLADLHLETHFGGRRRTKERLRRATLEAFERAVDFALDERLDAVLVAGDAFDDPLLSLRTEHAYFAGIEKLARAGVWFLSVCGNHDPGGSDRRTAGMGFDDGEGWEERVVFFRDRRPRAVQIAAPSGSPIAIVVGAGHETDRESRNLAADFHRLETDLPVVGLLHTQVESASAAGEHKRYAPSVREDFERVGYDYWALGHVHLRQRAFDELPVWYAGNLQGRSPRETGAKGGLLVELEAGAPAGTTFVPFAPVRWEAIELSELAELDSVPSLMEHLTARIEQTFADGPEELALRLELGGPCPLAARLVDEDERDALERELEERTGALEVQLRTERLRRPRDWKTLRETPSVLGKALELLERAAEDDRLLASLAPESLPGFEELEAEAELAGDVGRDCARLDYLRSLLGGAREELVTRCFEEES